MNLSKKWETMRVINNAKRRGNFLLLHPMLPGMCAVLAVGTRLA
jgi:hypothetical protein